MPSGPPANLAVTRTALESVLANTSEPAYELIVVDNGSADPTRQYLGVLGKTELTPSDCLMNFFPGGKSRLMTSPPM